MKCTEAMGLLYDEELWDDIIILYEISSPMPRGIEGKKKMAMHVYAGRAYYEEGRYILSSRAYNAALYEQSKMAKRVLTPLMFSDSEIRYRLARTEIAREKYDLAMKALDEVPESFKSPKILNLMNKLEIKFRNSPTVKIERYKKILSKCVYAIGACNYIVSEAGEDKNIYPDMNDVPFLSIWSHSQWLKGQHRWYEAALHLITNNKFNPRLCALESGYLLSICGLREEATDQLLIAYSCDNQNIDGLSLLSFLLGVVVSDSPSRYKQLEDIVSEWMELDMNSPVTLLGMAQLHRLRSFIKRPLSDIQDDSDRLDIPLHFIQRSIHSSGLNPIPYAILIKVLCYFALEKHDVAKPILIRTITEDPYNVSLYELLVEGHMFYKERSSAKAVAVKCMEHIKSPRAELLLAKLNLKSGLEKVSSCHSRMKGILKRYPYYTDAACLYSDYLADKEMYAEAIEVLEKVIKNVPFILRVVSGKLSIHLGRILSKKEEYKKSYEQYHRATMLDGIDMDVRLDNLDVDIDESEEGFDDDGPSNRKRGRRMRNASPPRMRRLEDNEETNNDDSI